MGHHAVLFLAISVVGTMGFIPHGSFGEKDHMLTEALLREVVERMGKDFDSAASGYLGFPSSDRNLELMARARKELENEQLDYESLIESNPSPSLRDQEFLQHSSLWWPQDVTADASEAKQRPQPSGKVPKPKVVKTDAVLPAYCNPPNPCPVGYSGFLSLIAMACIIMLITRVLQTEDMGCIVRFENTAAFSREYQLSQRCVCDEEHMFSCPQEPPSDLDMRFPDHHKSMVAKKYMPNVEINPFLTGERLPIAAKKGFNVISY